MSLSRADAVELYFEKNISEQCATGNGAGLIPQFVEATIEGLPSTFWRNQLGMAEGEYPSIIEVQRHVRKRNADHRDDARAAENDRIKALLAAAKKAKLRTFVRPVPVLRGCTGCSSCIPDVRLSPVAAPGTAPGGAWSPMRPNAWAAVMTGDEPVADDLFAVIARIGSLEHFAQRRKTIELEQQHRLGRDRERQMVLRKQGSRPRRRSDGRPAMKKRRAAAKVMQDAVRRTLDEG